MPLEYKMTKVIATRGTKKLRQYTSGMKTQITILACASTSGQTIPPMVVFAGKHFNSVLAKVKYLLHYTLELIKLAAEHQVVIFFLPPHTTANSQPLDTTCFKLLKSYWVDVCVASIFLHIQVK